MGRVADREDELLDEVEASRIRELMDAGADPTGADAMDVADAQRAPISRWFYVMDHAFHVQESELYVQDERFRAGIEQNTHPGAAEWLQAAIIANAERALTRTLISQPHGCAT